MCRWLAQQGELGQNRGNRRLGRSKRPLASWGAIRKCGGGGFVPNFFWCASSSVDAFLHPMKIMRFYSVWGCHQTLWIYMVWAMDVTKTYEFIWFRATDVTKPYKFIGFGDIHGPKPYKSIGIHWFVFRSLFGHHPCAGFINMFLWLAPIRPLLGPYWPLLGPY